LYRVWIKKVIQTRWQNFFYLTCTALLTYTVKERHFSKHGKWTSIMQSLRLFWRTTSSFDVWCHYANVLEWLHASKWQENTIQIIFLYKYVGSPLDICLDRTEKKGKQTKSRNSNALREEKVEKTMETRACLTRLAQENSICKCMHMCM